VEDGEKSQDAQKMGKMQEKNLRSWVEKTAGTIPGAKRIKTQKRAIGGKTENRETQKANVQTRNIIHPPLVKPGHRSQRDKKA